LTSDKTAHNIKKQKKAEKFKNDNEKTAGNMSINLAE
jgi:hypothetical protein